jgi:hypothetical protein
MKAKVVFMCGLSLFFLVQNTVYGQSDEGAKTLFSNNAPLQIEDVGFYGAPMYGYSQIDGSNVSLIGFRGGVSIKDRFSVGAFYNISINQIRPNSETIPNIYMDYWAAGGLIEYTAFSKKLVHLTFPLHFGYGEVQMDSEFDSPDLDEANFFLVEPTALLEINLHKYARLNIGAGYRFIENMTYRNLTQTDLSGLTGYIGLRFGLFR